MDERVQEFLENIKSLDAEKYAILQNAREIVFRVMPKTSERFIYGGIMFSLEADFGGAFTSKNHISFEFGKGYLFDDPEGMLEGAGKFRRHLKLRTEGDLIAKNAENFVKQAVHYAKAQK